MISSAVLPLLLLFFSRTKAESIRGRTVEIVGTATNSSQFERIESPFGEQHIDAKNDGASRALLLSDWSTCSSSSQCTAGCCSKMYSGGILKCTPLGSGFNPSANGCVSAPVASPVASPVGKLSDWSTCSLSTQCSAGCCSSMYSGGILKCTPLGSNFNPTANGCISVSSPVARPVAAPVSGGVKTFSVADIQAGLNRYNALQGGSRQATQDIANKFNAIPKSSLYRQVALLAHMIWESGGFQFTEEIAAINWPYSNMWNYQICDWNTNQQASNGKAFYGRGYIQLSWCANYKAYGRARMINNDPDYFYKNPETVATTYAVDSAAWFFDANVPDNSGRFGATTKSVNGAIECNSGNSYVGSIPQKRWQIFQAIATQVGLTGYVENGCYN